MARKMQNDMSLLCPRLSERLEEGFTRFEGAFWADEPNSNYGRLTTSSPTATEETQKLLPIYIKEIQKYDEYISSAQNDNVTGVLVAVSHDLPILVSLAMTYLKDWSLFRDRRRFYA